MKKRALALCLAAAATLAACTDKPDPSPTQTPSQPQHTGYTTLPLTEGVYNPPMRVQSDLDSRAEQNTLWLWGDDHLNGLADMGLCAGDYTERSRFSYNGQRLQSITSVSGMLQGTLRFEYSNQQISAFALERGEVQLLSATTQHAQDGKLQRVEGKVDDSYLTELAQWMSSLTDGGDMPLPFATATKGGRKLSYEGITFGIDFGWQAENVATTTLTASLTMSTTLNELNQFIDLTQLLGTEQVVNTALSLLGDTPLPVSISFADTVTYSYDTHVNPVRGMLGKLSVATLSANNTTAEHHSTGVGFALNIELPRMGSMPINYNYPAVVIERTFSIEYNNDELPLRFTDQEGYTINYEYEQ